MARRNGKVDDNQAEIVAALRRAGASVESLANMGDGITDLLVGVANRNYLLEVKSKNGKLTPAQVIWHRDWRGQKAIVRDPIEALRCVGLTR